jgi:hypothetical protein
MIAPKAQSSRAHDAMRMSESRIQNDHPIGGLQGRAANASVFVESRSAVSSSHYNSTAPASTLDEREQIGID